VQLPVPESETLAMFLIGAAALVVARRHGSEGEGRGE
jgi:hypothetical protein